MIEMKTVFLWIIAIGLAVAACSSRGGWSADPKPLRTVPFVDLYRYLGTWYEVGRYPNRFQQNCQGSSALYRLLPDGDIEVVNSCRDRRDGRLRQAKGRAWIVDPASNARLKVSFFWPFRGDYWIIDLDRDYQYAVVGTPNRKYLWILSRTPTISDEAYGKICRGLAEQGYDCRNLVTP